MVGAILVSHENLSLSMADVLAKITGESASVVPVSSKGISPGLLEQAIVDAIESLKDTQGIILFTDLYGGSCSLVCSRVQRRFPEIAVITGVNLPLLIDFVFNREKPIEEIVERLVRKGREGIQYYSWGEKEKT
jgi:mannose/fructose-specific phosphotransferase system component IIA